MRFHNQEDGIVCTEIADTGDYLVEREGKFYYWIESTSPYENHGPFDTAKEAIEAYKS